MTYDGMPQEYSDNLATANLIFTGVFITECVIKLISLGTA